MTRLIRAVGGRLPRKPSDVSSSSKWGIGSGYLDKHAFLHDWRTCIRLKHDELSNLLDPGHLMKLPSGESDKVEYSMTGNRCRKHCCSYPPNLRQEKVVCFTEWHHEATPVKGNIVFVLTNLSSIVVLKMLSERE